jgi:hypothetical protein
MGFWKGMFPAVDCFYNMALARKCKDLVTTCSGTERRWRGITCLRGGPSGGAEEQRSRGAEEQRSGGAGGRDVSDLSGFGSFHREEREEREERRGENTTGIRRLVRPVLWRRSSVASRRPVETRCRHSRESGNPVSFLALHCSEGGVRGDCRMEGIAAHRRVRRQKLGHFPVSVLRRAGFPRFSGNLVGDRGGILPSRGRIGAARLGGRGRWEAAAPGASVGSGRIARGARLTGGVRGCILAFGALRCALLRPWPIPPDSQRITRARKPSQGS